MKTSVLVLISTVLITSCSTFEQNGKTKILLTKEINQIYKDSIFNGFAVSVVNESGALYTEGFGFSDIKERKKYTDKTIQNIASISKTFVGISLLKAQELGKLNLDEPIEKHLSFKVFNPNFPNEKITIRQLATHTSSIIDNTFYLSKNYYLKPNQNLNNIKLNFDNEQIFNQPDSIISMGLFLENILTKNGKWNKKSFSRNKPGSIYEYSNIATALAAYIVEKATKETFQNFTNKYILQPLKMSNSGWKFEDIEFSKFSRLYENPTTPLPYYEMVTFPDGGFITSASDLSKFLTELIKGYNGKGSILSKESYKEYFHPQLSASNFTERNEQNPYNESYNVGVFIGFGYTGYIGHTGGDPGVLSMMFFNTKSNIGRIMIYNTNFSDKKGNDAFYKIWDLLEKYQSKL